MRTLILSLVMCAAACGVDDQTPQVDAGPAVVDAQPDAPPPVQQQKGCTMGNMPLAMTEVPSEGDPVSHALLIELQEMVVGDKHQYRTFFVPAEAFCLTSGTGALANGIWTLTAANTRLEAPLPIAAETEIRQLEAFYIRESGASTSSYTLTIKTITLRVGQAPVVATPVTVTVNNGVNFPNLDSIAANTTSGNGLPYFAPPTEVSPFDRTALRWQLDVFQSGGPFDAQFYGVYFAIQKT